MFDLVLSLNGVDCTLSSTIFFSLHNNYYMLVVPFPLTLASDVPFLSSYCVLTSSSRFLSDLLLSPIQRYQFFSNEPLLSTISYRSFNPLSTSSNPPKSTSPHLITPHPISLPLLLPLPLPLPLTSLTHHLTSLTLHNNRFGITSARIPRAV